MIAILWRTTISLFKMVVLFSSLLCVRESKVLSCKNELVIVRDLLKEELYFIYVFTDDLLM